jgi:F-type H+-transporting ATPase subunit alpha
MPDRETTTLTAVLNRAAGVMREVLEQHQPDLTLEEIGRVSGVDNGIARVAGLPTVASREMLRFSSGLPGMAFDLREEELGVILLGPASRIEAGDAVRRTGRVLDAPVGEAVIGRVLDPVGRPLDDRGEVHATARWPAERPAPAIMDRAPVAEPLQTGIKVVDALIPIGRGQRELILGDRQTGKTAVALDTILNQADSDVICIYCAIGQQDAAVARLIATLRQEGALDYTAVIVASGEDAPGLQFVAPYAATSMGEYFMEQGEDVLIVYDDLTQHARAYREISLLLRRPPGREAYPGDIFYVHSRMLERSTHLTREAGGGSLTALPIIETQAQNISAYIPTNLISITDGQIYLSPDLFQKGVLPAVDVGRSVSRVGGEAQLPAYQAVAGDLRLAYSQFEELESFARFGTRLDEETRHTLERGRRVREVFKQPQSQPIPAPEQIAVLLVTTKGVFDQLPLDKIGPVAERLRQTFAEELPDHYQQIQEGKPLSDEAREEIVDLARHLIGQVQEEEHGND